MQKKAFTLIELLVVIAVIALLLTIALPALRTAREQGRSVYCKNNLRQMALAAAVYVHDFDGRFPVAHYSTQAAWAAAPGDVDAAVVDPPDDQDPPSDPAFYSYCWDYTTVTAPGRQPQISAGVLWQGETIDQVHKCPSYKDAAAGIDPFSGYNYNTSYIGHGENERYAADYTGAVRPHPTRPGEYIVMPARLADLRSPGTCALFGEGQYAGGANKFMRSPVVWAGDADWSLRPGGTQGFRHNGRTNTAWADGHVTDTADCFTDTHPKFKAPLEAHNAANPVKIGFLGPDNTRYSLK